MPLIRKDITIRETSNVSREDAISSVLTWLAEMQSNPEQVDDLFYAEVFDSRDKSIYRIFTPEAKAFYEITTNVFDIITPDMLNFQDHVESELIKFKDSNDLDTNSAIEAAMNAAEITNAVSFDCIEHRLSGLEAQSVIFTNDITTLKEANLLIHNRLASIQAIVDDYADTNNHNSLIDSVIQDVETINNWRAQFVEDHDENIHNDLLSIKSHLTTLVNNMSQLKIESDHSIVAIKLELNSLLTSYYTQDEVNILFSSIFEEEETQRSIPSEFDTNPSNESIFDGVSIEKAIHVPTQLNNTAKFRINTSYPRMEFYNSTTDTWMSENHGSFVTTKNLIVDDNMLFDTKSFNGISSSSSIPACYIHTWSGVSTTGINASIDKLLYNDAITEWEIPEITYNSKLHNNVMLKIIIENNSNIDFNFLHQPMLDVIGSTQIRGYFYTPNALNANLTNNIKFQESETWKYLYHQNEKWKPHVKPGGILELYMIIPYVSTGWNSDDVVWKDNHNPHIELNTIVNDGSQVVMADTFDNVLNSDIELTAEIMNLMVTNLDKLVYDKMISVLKTFHVDDFLAHDLEMNRFNESIRFESDRNMNVDLEEKYPFLLHYATEYNHSFVNIASRLKNKICAYRELSRVMFRLYNSIMHKIMSADSMSEIKSIYETETNSMHGIASEVYETASAS